MRVGELQAVLAEGGQEWPVDAPHDATVGGVIAAGVSSFRRLRLGHVRDTVVELELVRGDGLLVKSGARTVKNVTGYDVHRLATGSLGTLGVIVQVALKLRPLPQVRRMLTIEGDGLDARSPACSRPSRCRRPSSPSPAGCACGWRAGPTRSRSRRRRRERWTPTLPVDHHPAPFDPLAHRRADGRRGGGGAVAHRRRGRRPRRLDRAPRRRARVVRARRERAGRAGRHPRGRGGGRAASRRSSRASAAWAPRRSRAVDVHRRLKESFDPAGIMAPGRCWGGL